MAYEGTKQSSETAPDAVAGLKSEMDAKLGAVTEQLKAMNEQFAQSLQQITNAVKPPPQRKPVFTDDDIYDAGKLEEKVAAKAGEIAASMLNKEREMNAAIYNLSQDYPEIQTDPAMKKAVLEAHSALPVSVRDSAFGYETAVLKAVTKAGLIPKSKRTVEVEEPVAPGSRGEGSRSRDKKPKLDQRSIEFARLLGQPVDDPAYQKRLEQANARDTYSKYR